ncbi:hypothetical protein BV25DRAFT_1853703 [Artomyces pyxidatus]|uniref:Uncharacterized protein n=1 Tax=Artomyces pyxidatus TaxID=48021 RepID=A0ACB8T512_9AGAM|nr:hypothetical protein BV25DRAFT_1853703 [Artomyces pyxidatus]
MLFRADFVRQKHVPGTIETNHGSLSKIIGNCWRALPLDEKRVWEIKAKHAKAEHKTMYPDYRFRPVHNKNKEKKAKVAIPAEDEQRCEDVAQMLLDGLKGEELAAAVKRLDRMRSTTPAAGPPRRPSSVPLPNAFPIALPALPFTQSRPQSPDFRLMRRPSSAQPFHAWTNPFSFTRPHSPLPEVNASLFQKDFLEHFPVAQPDGSFNFDSLFSSLPGGPAVHHDLNISPLDNIVPTDPSAYAPYTESADPYTWQAPPDISGASHSDPSSIYSGSPAPSDMSLPLHAPQPQRAFEHWMDMPAPKEQQQQHQQQQYAPNTQLDMQAYTQGLHDMGIVPGMGLDVSAFAGFDVSGMFAPEQCVQPPTFEFNDMIHEY